jgi:hypothetical protein
MAHRDVARVIREAGAGRLSEAIPTNDDFRAAVDAIVARGVRNAQAIGGELDAAGLIDGGAYTVQDVRQALDELGYVGLSRCSRSAPQPSKGERSLAKTSPKLVAEFSCCDDRVSK